MKQDLREMVFREAALRGRLAYLQGQECEPFYDRELWKELPKELTAEDRGEVAALWGESWRREQEKQRSVSELIEAAEDVLEWASSTVRWGGYMETSIAEGNNGSDVCSRLEEAVETVKRDVIKRDKVPS